MESPKESILRGEIPVRIVVPIFRIGGVGGMSGVAAPAGMVALREARVGMIVPVERGTEVGEEMSAGVEEMIVLEAVVEAVLVGVVMRDEKVARAVVLIVVEIVAVEASLVVLIVEEIVAMEASPGVLGVVEIVMVGAVVEAVPVGVVMQGEKVTRGVALIEEEKVVMGVSLVVLIVEEIVAVEASLGVSVAVEIVVVAVVEAVPVGVVMKAEKVAAALVVGEKVVVRGRQVVSVVVEIAVEEASLVALDVVGGSPVGATETRIGAEMVNPEDIVAVVIVAAVIRLAEGAEVAMIVAGLANVHSKNQKN